MKLAVVTTFPPNRWTAYAERMLKSHIEFWPDDVILYAYHEGDMPTLVHKKVKFINIEEVNPDLVAFKKKTQGRSCSKWRNAGNTRRSQKESKRRKKR